MTSAAMSDSSRMKIIPVAIAIALALSLFRGPLTFLIGNYATVAVAVPVAALVLLVNFKTLPPLLRRPEVIVSLAFIAWAGIKIPFSAGLLRGVLGFVHITFPIGVFLLFLWLIDTARPRADWFSRTATALSAILMAGFVIETYFDMPLSNLVQHTTPGDVASVFAPFRTGSFIGASLPFGVVLGLLAPFVFVTAVRQRNIISWLVLAAYMPMIFSTYGRGAMLQSSVALAAACGLLLINRWMMPADERSCLPNLFGWRPAIIALTGLALLPFLYAAIPGSIAQRFESGLVSVCKIAQLGSACSFIPELQSQETTIPELQVPQSLETTCEAVANVTDRLGKVTDADNLFERCVENADDGLDVSSIVRFEIYRNILDYQDTWPKRLFGNSLMSSGNFVKYFGFDYLIPGVNASESYYLKLYSELGLIGLGLFLSAFLLVMIRAALRVFDRRKGPMTFICIAAAAALAGIAPEMAFLQSLENPVVAVFFGWVMAIGAFSVADRGDSSEEPA